MQNYDSFKDLGLSALALKAIEKKGFEEPTPIQKKIIPMLLKNTQDLIGQALTGTGKTAAFGLPILENIQEKNKYPQVLILAPTRELALQVSEELNSLKNKPNIQIIPIYGGQSMELQYRHLERGIHIVVGTPGRIIDHLRRKTLKLDKISYLVLDEADEMLAMGFIDDIEIIMKQSNPARRTLLFSATMPDRILKLAKKYMKNPEHVKDIAQQITGDLTDQIYFEVNSSDKFDALSRIIDVEPEFYGLIFCRTILNVNGLKNQLQDRGYDVDCLHGDISQNLRERILKKFKEKKINILVATDVAARGLDIYELTHVINYSLPQDPESYIHRIGRTGRAGRQGTAITFITPSEYRKLMFIKKFTGKNIRRGEVPGVERIIQTRLSIIKNSIQEIMDKKEFQDYLKLAKELIKNNAPEDIIASILKYSFKDELTVKQYNKISPINIDTNGTTRLFVAKGTKDGFSPRKLIQFIREKAEINNEDIQQIKIFDKFSFLTVPFREAEIILENFRNNTYGQRSLVVKAKPMGKK